MNQQYFFVNVSDLFSRLKSFILIVNIFAAHQASSQSQDTVQQELTIDFEIQPRAEFRNDFMWQPADSVMPEFYVSQRNRIGLTYERPKWKFHASPQEIHVWGKSGKSSAIGNIGVYELYIEPRITKNLSIRIGRQSLSLDNGRMFSAAPWSQQGRSHEGVRIFYASKKSSTDLTAAFTRTYEKHFIESYSPVASHDYKALFVHHLKHKVSNNITLTTINATDVFENAKGKYYTRTTNGGRVEYVDNSFYVTLSAYYQWGKSSSMKTIRAYYAQPEISKTFGNTTVRLGAEILSGESASHNENFTYSFVPLYGVAWKFMGNMNLFTKFPRDVKDRGLINPYVFVIHQVDEKFSIRNDVHLFYSQYSLTDSDNHTVDKYLGLENDLSMRYKPVKRFEVIFGFSFFLPEKSIELLGKVADADKIPVWSYLMISYSPTLFHHKSGKG